MNNDIIIKNTLAGLEKLDTFSKKNIFILNTIILLIIAVLDYVTGYEIAFSIFYLIPVSIAAWFLGSTACWIFSFFSAVAWVLLDVGSGHLYSSLVIAFWNGLVRLGFFVIVSELLSALKGALLKEKIRSRIDFLTGIPNARSFYEEGEKEIYRAKRYEKPLTIAYIDADNFKQVNDEFGHDKGDELLKSIGKEIVKGIRGSDFAARLGGDEFAIIFPETDTAKARIIVYKIKKNLDEMITKVKLPVTFSIGVVTCISRSCTLQELIKHADNQMYKVKKKGKNNVFCHSI